MKEQKVPLYPKYIHNTFHAFTIKQKYILLDLKEINKYTKLKSMICVNSISNVLSQRVIKLFKNIEEITIYAYQYKFCLLSLLHEIGDSLLLLRENDSRIIIQWNDNSMISTEIENEYKDKCFAIKQQKYETIAEKECNVIEIESLRK